MELIQHEMDNSQSCAWCCNFICCMREREDAIVHAEGKVFCDDDCKENYDRDIDG